MNSSEVTRPIIRYHGGKFLLAEWIISHFPPHRVYVEPFGGGASVLLQKPRSYAEIYNDIEGEIVNLFEVMRDDGDTLADKLRLTPFARDEYRNSFEVSTDPLEQARRTIIRTFMGFGSNAFNRKVQSGFRASATRSGTTPAHDWGRYPDSLQPIIDRLRGVVIENREAVAVMEHQDGDETLHYCDPPYVHDTRSQLMHGDHGYAHEMTDEQHGQFLDAAMKMRGMVCISGYANPLYDQRLSSWNRVEVAAHADGARDRTEVLWMNYKLRQHKLF